MSAPKMHCHVCDKDIEDELLWWHLQGKCLDLKNNLETFGIKNGPEGDLVWQAAMMSKVPSLLNRYRLQEAAFRFSACHGWKPPY